MLSPGGQLSNHPLYWEQLLQAVAKELEAIVALIQRVETLGQPEQMEHLARSEKFQRSVAGTMRCVCHVA